MIFMMIFAAMSGLMTLAFSILPGSDFLPFPSQVGTTIAAVSGWFSWFLGLTGEDLKAVYIEALSWWVTLNLGFLLLDILRRFQFPVVNKFLR